MKRVYIAHPLRGRGAWDEEWNRRAVNWFCREIAEDHPDVLPFSPIHALSFFTTSGDQTTVLRHCRKWLEVCDELWVFGDWETSEGCQMEIMTAEALNIPVIYKDASKRAGG